MIVQTFRGEGESAPPPRLFPRFVLPVFAKLNLTLRVTGRRPDGYHTLASAFLRIPSGETLLVEPAAVDSVELHGLDLRLEGENIVSKALRLSRENGAEVPPLKIEIFKALPPGSGLGSGSGNAAVILRWLAAQYSSVPPETWQDIACRTGADVPFLFSGCQAAQVTGIGEKVEPFLSCVPLSGLVAFPDWDVGTGNAYAALDACYTDGYPLSGEQALLEARHKYFTLMKKKYAGLLPNDFAPGLIREHPQYKELFALFEDVGALGWGITGSGGAAFAILSGLPPAILWPDWVRQVLAFTL